MIALFGLLFASGCTKDTSLLGQGSSPGAPAPFGYGETPSKTSTPQESFKIANKGVSLKTTENTSLSIGSEDGLLEALKNYRKESRSADTLVDATRSTLGFMNIQKDIPLDKKNHYIETDWYNGYKAKAMIDTTQLHASSLNLKVIDKNGKEISPSRRIAIENAIFRQTKIINYGNR